MKRWERINLETFIFRLHKQLENNDIQNKSSDPIRQHIQNPSKLRALIAQSGEESVEKIQNEGHEVDRREYQVILVFDKIANNKQQNAGVADEIGDVQQDWPAAHFRFRFLHFFHLYKWLPKIKRIWERGLKLKIKVIFVPIVYQIMIA